LFGDDHRTNHKASRFVNFQPSLAHPPIPVSAVPNLESINVCFSEGSNIRECSGVTAAALAGQPTSLLTVPFPDHLVRLAQSDAAGNPSAEGDYLLLTIDSIPGSGITRHLLDAVYLSFTGGGRQFPDAIPTLNANFLHGFTDNDLRAQIGGGGMSIDFTSASMVLQFPATVPEPSAIVLLGTGLLAIFAVPRVSVLRRRFVRP
jgi:hypothetical protein